MKYKNRIAIPKINRKFKINLDKQLKDCVKVTLSL